MKRSLIIAFALVTLVSSCDFVRTLAGRPTSAQLEQIRQQRMAAEEARHQATLDSMERVQKHMAIPWRPWRSTCWIPLRRRRERF